MASRAVLASISSALLGGRRGCADKLDADDVDVDVAGGMWVCCRWPVGVWMPSVEDESVSEPRLLSRRFFCMTIDLRFPRVAASLSSRWDRKYCLRHNITYSEIEIEG